MRKPTTLQNPAGLRSEPPRSLPSAIGTIPVASAAAAPPLLPPHVFVMSYGLRVAPNSALKVCDPAPNSGTFVLPIVMAPAARSRSTISASASGTKRSNSGEPKVVRIPFVQVRSLCATGSPCSGPSASPRATAASAASASRRAASGSSVTMALTAGLTSSMRARCASSTSTAEISRAAIARASSAAVRKQRSLEEGIAARYPNSATP